MVEAPSVQIRALHASYGARVAIRDLSLDCVAGAVTAVIGPSGCGKSTMLRCVNRLHESAANARVSGAVFVGQADVYARAVDVVALRRRIGMVFQRPTPFPTLSIFENVASGIRASGIRASNRALSDSVEAALQRSGLWPEVSHQLIGVLEELVRDVSEPEDSTSPRASS